MNYYERVQESLDYIDEHLQDRIDIDGLAYTSCMSKPTFYRVFYYLVGHSVYGYIKQRRLSEAARMLKETDRNVIDIALDFQYSTHESFTRAFKAHFSVTPLGMRKKRVKCEYFERINIMSEKTFVENYPGVKTIEFIPAIRVASCHKMGVNSEDLAWGAITSWANRNGIDHTLGKVRQYCFDNPDIGLNPDAVGDKHGFEVWIEVADDVSGDDEVVIKNFPGGHYATMKTSLANIGVAWKSLVSWTNKSKYKIACHQCLEEPVQVLFLDEAKQEIDVENTFMKVMMPIENPQ